MSHFALKRFSHVRPLTVPTRHAAVFFQASTEQRLQKEDRLIAIGLLVCFAVQLIVLVF